MSQPLTAVVATTRTAVIVLTSLLSLPRVIVLTPRVIIVSPLIVKKTPVAIVFVRLLFQVITIV